MEEEIVDEIDVVEDEVVEKPVKVKKPKPQTPDFIRAESGDSYLSIAARFCGDENPNKCARDLFALNNGAIVRAGSKIFLKEIR